MKFSIKWIKKTERSLPEDKTCRNCGTQTQGRYCHQCGQDIFAGTGIPILQLIIQMLDNVFGLEGKTPRTLGYLLIRPGFLSVEFKNGRINHYVNPVKLFWMSTIVFFAIFIFQIDRSNWQNNTDVNVKINNTIIESIENDADYENEALKEAIKVDKTKLVSTFIQFFTKIAPYISFLCIPFFALLLLLFFWKNKYFYVHHLIFTIHFHSFLWIFFSLIFLKNLFFKFHYPNWLATILFLIPGIYLMFALHRFYNPKVNNFKYWWHAIWKSVFITIIYFFIISIVSVVLIYLFFRIKYPELLQGG
jgi:hypothetical protein